MQQEVKNNTIITTAHIYFIESSIFHKDYIYNRNIVFKNIERHAHPF